MKYRPIPISVFGLTIAAIVVILVMPSAIAAQSQRVLELPPVTLDYTPDQLPAYFNQPNISAADTANAANPISDAGATLGRVLFYDVALSANDTTSCASCHDQARAFSDPNQFSAGFEGDLTDRNSMGLSNARFYQPGSFFWDQSAATLEDQVLLPIQDHIEMGLDLQTLEVKLAALDYYAPLFDDAFGSTTVTSHTVSLALSQFVRSMISYQSKFDEGLTTNFANFTDEERQGRAIFNGPGNCNDCHETELQIANQPHNNGLELISTDEGLGAVTGNPQDVGFFKVPSLRNVAVTGPYMHDGRLATLDDVVQFYNAEVEAHANLSPEMRGRNGNPRRLGLSATQQDALVAFMHTLTDESFLTDERFSDPFVEVELPPTAVQVASTSAEIQSTPVPIIAILSTLTIVLIYALSLKRIWR